MSSFQLAFPQRTWPEHSPFRRYSPIFISNDGRFVVVLEEAPALPVLVYRDRHLLHDRLTGQTIATAWRDQTLTPTFIVASSACRAMAARILTLPSWDGQDRSS